ncbi:MAG: hypothetical protein HY220_02840 [Candidatus Sungbacteria bacterium]|uniref:Uncharacterized protein n=1 Tax=Candidatus Sungiibacteriota bacterium TaxID=2750080 RepID=A0A9D6LS03_9BACT|nr:hypothetical protein [Candidatus Sungbacteria bacterium]
MEKTYHLTRLAGCSWTAETPDRLLADLEKLLKDHLPFRHYGVMHENGQGTFQLVAQRVMDEFRMTREFPVIILGFRDDLAGPGKFIAERFFGGPDSWYETRPLPFANFKSHELLLRHIRQQFSAHLSCRQAARWGSEARSKLGAEYIAFRLHLLGREGTPFPIGLITLVEAKEEREAPAHMT